MAVSLAWKVLGVGLVFIAWLFSYWRHFVIAGSVSGFVLLPLYKVIPESPRWLVAHGHLDEAEAILTKFGAKRKNTLDRMQLRSTLDKVREDQLTRDKYRQTYHVTDMVKTRRMRRFTLVMCFDWFVISMVFFAMYLYVSRLSGNIYINTGIMYLADIPAMIVMWFSADRFGRRITFIVIMALSGVALIVLPFIQKDFPKVGTALAIAGKSLVGAEFALIYLITTELFPTVKRTISLGTGSMTAWIGAILAPFFVMMAQLPNVYLIVPLCLFGGLAMTAAFLSLLLQETVFSKMEQTIEAAEKASLDYRIPCRRGKNHEKQDIIKEEPEKHEMKAIVI